MTDEQIVELIRNNKNEKAFQALYKNFPMVRKLILSKGGKKEDAEDIFQEGLIILYRSVRKNEFKLTSKLSTYLYSVCRFLWKDEMIKRGKLSLMEFNNDLDKADEDGFNNAWTKEKNMMLAEKIINELGDRCKELLLLFYNESLRLKEIASRMGYSSENSVKNQKYKCLESAKTMLKEAKQLQ